MDEEDDDTLRERIVEYDRSHDISYVGNVADYKRWALSVPGVGAVTVIPAKDDSGIIKIILMDQNGVPASKQIQDAVYNYIMRPDSESDRLAPPNAVLEITAPETVVVNISAVVYLREAEIGDVQNDLKAALQSYLLNVSSNDSAVRISAINSILGAVSGIYDYDSVQINGVSKNVDLESGQQMIDYVSPIYGKSRIGLWLFQVIGLEIDDVKTICKDIFDQIFVDRATWGLPIWEKEYGITPLPDQTIEQRRTQILQMRIKRPLNPKRFEKIIEALSGVETKLIENTAKNTFQVNLYGEVNNYDEVVRRIDELKPAHLLCDIRVSYVIESETALNYAIVSGSCEYSSSIVSEV